jgi:hypothetical protein
MELMIVLVVNTILMASLDNRRREGAIRFEGSIILFYGSKCFFEISTITQDEMDTLPRIYIHGRSTKEYVPSIRAHSCLAINSIWTIVQSSTLEILFQIYSRPCGWQDSKCNNADGGYSWSGDSGTYARSFGLAITRTESGASRKRHGMCPYVLLINYLSPGIYLLDTILFSKVRFWCGLFDATKISRPINPSEDGNQLWCTKSDKVR